MSDGPHKSLNLPRHWRTVLKRLESRAYDDDDVRAAVKAALSTDHRNEVPAHLLATVRDHLTSRQTSLNGHEDIIDRLQCLKVDAGCQPLASALLDHACVGLRQGKFGSDALHAALAGAHSDRIRNVERQIHEHCLNDTSKKAKRVLGRIGQAMMDLELKSVGRALLSNRAPSMSETLTRRDGLDEGVPLP